MLHGAVKLGDFGIAKVLDYTSQICRTQCRTVNYMAPEVTMGREYTNKAHIWSLGCILYEFCTGQYPFESLQASLTGKYTPIKGDPDWRDVLRLIDWMLQKDPERRPIIKKVIATPLITRWMLDNMCVLVLEVASRCNVP